MSKSKVGMEQNAGIAYSERAELNKENKKTVQSERLAQWKAYAAWIAEYSGLRATGVRGFGNRHSGSQKTMIPGMETIHTMP